MKKLYFFIITITLFLQACEKNTSVQSQTKLIPKADKNPRIKQLDQKQIYYFEAPPFINNQSSGLFLDIIQELGITNEYTLTFYPSKRARKFFSLNDSSILLGSKLSPSASMDRKIYILPVVKLVYGFLGKKEIEEYSENKQLIGIHRGLKDQAIDIPEAYFKNWQFIEVETTQQSLSLLEQNRIDFFLADHNTALKYPSYNFHPVEALNIEAGLLSSNKEALEIIATKTSRSAINNVIHHYFKDDLYKKYLINKPLKVEEANRL